ncbi:MAG: transglycosylase SLT domain-containing protein [Xylophilus ampelinus]
MKFLTATSLACVLILTGCATTGNDAQKTASSDGTGLQPHTPLIPGGPLTPIARGHVAAPGVASLSPPADLWERIRRGFAMPDLDTDLVRDREQWYATRPDYIQRMTERSSKYLFHIVEELERRGMPTELALLPYIESAFNPQAVSVAKAAGMWQFMPATGTDYQLKQNMFRDDRRDVLASTRAALDYLQKLYNMFGDWQLALAAYNWGEGSVSRAIAKNQRLGLPTDYASLSMPNETRYYVPKLQAVKNIVANPQQFSAELPLIENHPYFQTVDLRRDIDVALAAKLANVSLDDFKALNPAARRPVILASGTPQILLPWDNAAVFRRNLEAYTDGQYASWTAWTAPSTMSVAAAAERVGMSESDLRSSNSIPPHMLIKAGSTLIVPRTAAMQDDVQAHIADNATLAFLPEIVTRRTVVKAGRRETVATIARRFRVMTASVAQWNDVASGAAFRPGQDVVVYLPVSMKVPAVASSPAVSTAPARIAVQVPAAGGRKAAASASAPTRRTAAAAGASNRKAAAPNVSASARKTSAPAASVKPAVQASKRSK